MSRTYSIKETSKSVAVLRKKVPVAIYDKRRKCWFTDGKRYHGNTRNAIARYRRQACDPMGVAYKIGVDVHPGIFRSLGGGKAWN